MLYVCISVVFYVVDCMFFYVVGGGGGGVAVVVAAALDYDVISVAVDIVALP